MDNETPELIEEQMRETRAALTEKVAALEETVMGTIQSANSAVQDTVETVQHAVEDTVQTVKSTIGETMHSASETLRETFDFSGHVRERPWATVGSAIAAGLFTGFCLSHWSRRPARGKVEVPRPQPAAEMPRRIPSLQPRESGEPAFVDHLWQRVRCELDKIAEKAITTVSANLQKTIDEGVPKLMEDLVESSHSDSLQSASASNGHGRTQRWS